MGDLLKRSAWIFLAAVFVLSSVGIVIGSFVLQGDESKNTAQEENVNQLAGTKLEGFTPVDDIPELQKIDQNVGSGAEAKAGSKVVAHYTGAVAATGIIFQSSLDRGEPVPFSLTEVIKGWTEGVPGMKEGGSRRLLIPADLAYGANPPAGSGIPANADLVFDIVLIKVE